MAKAPLADVLANAANRQTDAVHQVLQRRLVATRARRSARRRSKTGNPDNALVERLVQRLSQPVRDGDGPAATQNDGGNLYLSTSSDGVNWGPRQAIAVDRGEQFYPSLVGTGPDPPRTGKSMYVYYTDSAAGAWNRWNDAQLVRREIGLTRSIPAPTPRPPPDSAHANAAVNDGLGYGRRLYGRLPNGQPRPGWQYSWNAGGNGARPSAYQPLIWSDVAGAYNTTGDSHRGHTGGGSGQRPTPS